MGGPGLDATTLRAVMARFVAALREHRDELNSLNVYPVPDGDTGTNMLLTQQAVEDALQALGPGGSLERTCEAISRSSLMGARGNSGVILSQVLRGICDRVLEAGGADAAAVASALRAGADEAHASVAEPAEGTVLTVLADAARAAGEAASEADATPGSVAAAAYEEATSSVERTRDVLPVLRAAGVIDAGGKGILLLLAALVTELSGVPVEVAVGPMGPVSEAETAEDETSVEFRFEVQYLLDAADEMVPSLRDRLARLGDSLVVVGGGGTFKVHVHTNEPGAAVEEALDAGRPRQIVIADLAGQVAAHCLTGQARAVQVERQLSGLVAVAEGRGLEAVFRSLGAVVVRGGPGSNPSVADLLEAVETAPGTEVVLLPNHPNVVAAAERAAGESSKLVWVLPTASVPAGVSAATAFNPTTSAEENLESMRWAADGCTAGEVTRAVRDATTPAGAVREGDWLGLSGGEVVATGDDPAAVAARLVRGLLDARHEILSVFVGAEPTDQEAERVVEALRSEVPEREVEVHRGHQPASAYLIGLE